MASKPNPKLQNEEETIPPPRQSSISRFGSRLVGRLLSLLPAIAFLFLTVNVVTSAYHARQDPGTLAFVLSSYVNLLLLFWCLKKFESLEEDSPPEEKERLKVAIWVLATALNFTFAWRVAGMMPLALAVVIWATAGSIAVVGFYGLFMYEGETGHGIRHDDMKSSDGRRSPEGEV